MLQKQPSLFGRPAGVISRARALRKVASDLRLACSSLSKNEPRSFFVAFRLLSDFGDQLSIYFDAGEAALHFETIVRQCPDLGPRASVLALRHERFRSAFTSASALTGDGEKVCTQGISSQIEDLLDDFDDHERAEGELLRDFFEHRPALRVYPALGAEVVA